MVDDAGRKARGQVPKTAQIIDRRRLATTTVKVHNLRKSGCVIETPGFSDFSDEISLQFPGIDQLISANVVWRKNKLTGVTFEFGVKAADDLRGEARTKVSIPVVIYSPDKSWEVTGTIRDASKSGCRVQCEAVDQFPSGVLVKIDAVDRPIQASVVWYNDKDAGLKLLWHTANKLPDDLSGAA